jgi:hypothetical protein
MTEKLEYIVVDGRNAGSVLIPHRYADGNFRAYKTNSRNDPSGRRVRTDAELIKQVRIGYHVRMSSTVPLYVPSTVKPEIVKK